MTAAALLARLAALGVSARADGGALRLRPASAIPPALLAALRASKADVLALLATRANERVMVPRSAATGPATMPAEVCPACGGHVWWRLSVLSGGPGHWRCEQCFPPDPADWIDGCAVPAAAVR